MNSTVFTIQDRCFNSDWKQCKIANFVKDPLELTNVHAILRENYTQLKV